MLQESEERVHRRAFKELGRFTPNWVTDTWSLPSGENKPIHPDNRTPEEKEAARIYWCDGKTSRSIYLERSGYKLQENQCEYCLRIKKTENHKCNFIDS